MYKQKLIKKLGYARYSDTNDERYNYYNKGIDTAISLASKLDEPERPVVPQFVADWYEEHIGGDFEYNLYSLYVDFYEQKLEGDLKEWVGNGSKNKPIQTLVNMHQFGYEVQKKEKLYKVSFKKNGFGIGVQQQDGSFKEQFAKEELSEYGFDNLEVYEIEEVEE